MIAVVSSHRNVAVVKVEKRELIYRTRGSSQEKVIGTLPEGGLMEIIGRKPAMRSPYLVVQMYTAPGPSRVYAAQLGLHKVAGQKRRQYRLGPWEEV
jgi:hypothetical protein